MAFRKIAWSFSHAMYVVHRVHCCEEDRLSSSLEACSTWNQSISYCRIQFIRVPDVPEVLGKSFRNQKIVLRNAGSIALSPECPGIA